MDNITTATPREIDTELADLYGKLYALVPQTSSAVDSIHYAAKDKKCYHGRRYMWNMTFTEAHASAQARLETANSYDAGQIQHVLDRYADLVAQSAAIKDQMQPLNAEFRRRGGWTRFHLVINNGGHIHSSMHCSTCRPTTQFGWLPDLSGKSEAETLKDLADNGSILCTVCYPSAPVTVVKETGCKGSRGFDYDHQTARRSYSGGWAKCNHCGEVVTLTSTHKMRKHG